MIVPTGMEEPLSCNILPAESCTRLGTNNPLQSLMRETRRRTADVGVFPDGISGRRAVAARLWQVASIQ